MYYYEYSQVGGSFGAELTAGSGPDVVLNVPLALRRLPLPYDAFGGGATNGCASVLNTSARSTRPHRQHCQGCENQSKNERTFVQAEAVRLIKGKVEILEHLREPEALHVVDEIRVGRVDVVDGRVRDGGRLEEGLNALHGGGGAVEVLDVAREPVRVEVRLEHLGPHVVVRGRDVEPVPVVEGNVTRGRG